MSNLLLAGALATASFAPAEQVVIEKVITRASLDIGSGDAKIVVADVDPKTEKISRIWHSSYITVGLKRRLVNNEFTKEVADDLVQTIKDLKSRALPFHPTEWAAAGTSVFRTASNGQELLGRIKQETGLGVLMLPHEKEGEVGFATAAAASGLSKDNMVSFDIGSGSFQIASMIDGNMEVYKAENLGFTDAWKMFCDIRKSSYEAKIPNPITESEAEALIQKIRLKLPTPDAWLLANQKQVVGIGSDDIAKKVIGHSPYTKDEVKKAYEKKCAMTPEQIKEYGFKHPHEVTVSLMLLYTMMDHCKIDEIASFYTNGSCEGLLVSPEYWPTTRAVLDIGSARTKIVVADVNPSTEKIVNIWHRDKKKACDLVLDKESKLSKDMGDSLIRTVKQIQEEVSDYHPKGWTAVATEIFRKAVNGEEFINRISAETGLKIRVIPQEEEAKLGFYTAVGASGKPKETVISWDSGSRSTQFATLIDDKLHIYNLKMGFLSVLKNSQQNFETGAQLPAPSLLQKSMS